MTQVSPDQDPVRIDSGHYSVEVDNEDVRVVRIKYGPREKSVMHSHPKSILVALTDFAVSFTYPDGKREEVSVKAGQVLDFPATTHLPENSNDTPLELIQIEIKG